MILADTSIWIDHLRAGDAQLAELLRAGRIVGHALVAAEIALGSLRDRARVLSLLDGLLALPLAREDEVRMLIERRRLFGAASASWKCRCSPPACWVRGRSSGPVTQSWTPVASDVGVSFG